MKAGIFVLLVLASTKAFPQGGSKSTKVGLGITGGQDASPHQFPYQVGIITSKDVCGGSLISPNYVLTAAYCLEYDETVELVFGAQNLTDKQEISQIRMSSARLIRHEDYSIRTKINNIALIELSEPITEENDAIKIVPITDGSDLYTGKEGIISGWGRTDQCEVFSRDILKYVTVPIISNEDCANADTYYRNFYAPTYMCTSGEGVVGACAGDWGSPLVVDGVQVAVVAFGYLFCHHEKPTVFTRLSEYRSWIAQNSDVIF